MKFWTLFALVVCVFAVESNAAPSPYWLPGKDWQTEQPWWRPQRYPMDRPMYPHGYPMIPHNNRWRATDSLNEELETPAVISEEGENDEHVNGCDEKEKEYEKDEKEREDEENEYKKEAKEKSKKPKRKA